MKSFKIVIFLLTVSTLTAWGKYTKPDNVLYSCSTTFSKSLWSFSVDLLKNLKNEAKSEDNIFVSPTSIYLALSTLHLGAGEKSRKDLAKILKIPDGDYELTSSNLHEELAKIQSYLKSDEPTQSKAVLANGLFVQKSTSIKDTFKEQLKKYYDGGAINVDFTNGNEATDSINKWISEKTLGRIPKFFTQQIDPSTVATLVSTLYFNGRWLKEFSQSLTKQEVFDTGRVKFTTPMMQQISSIEFFSNRFLQYDTISIPYIGGEYSMSILLPHKSQTIGNLTDHLDHLTPLTHVEKSNRVKVDYKIPKMKFNWRNSLKESLRVNDILTNIDLKELTDGKMHISDIEHATELEVDEEGTTASAVTSIKLAGSSYDPSDPVKFHVDRPFIVRIVHAPSCADLFIGIVRKPI